MNYKILTTQKFDKWFKGIKDKKVKFRIEARMSLMSKGHFGDHKSLDASISELRFFFGGGIRIYYAIRGHELILLLNAGNKTTQETDIETAKTLFSQLEE